MNVVYLCESGAKTTCQNLPLVSILENTLLPCDVARISFTLRRGKFSRKTLLFNMMRSTQIRTSSEDLGTTTMLAHYSLSSSTCSIIPSSCIRQEFKGDEIIHVKDVRYCTLSPFSKQPIQSGRLDEHSLFVKNIPKYIDEKTIQKLFSPFGPFGFIKLFSKEQYPCNREFINLKSKDSCQAAIDNLKVWKDKQGNNIYVEFKNNFGSSRDTNIGHQRKSMSENTPTLCPRPYDGLQRIPRGSRRSPGNYATDSHFIDKCHGRANNRLGGGQHTFFIQYAKYKSRSFRISNYKHLLRIYSLSLSQSPLVLPARGFYLIVIYLSFNYYY